MAVVAHVLDIVMVLVEVHVVHPAWGHVEERVMEVVLQLVPVDVLLDALGTQDSIRKECVRLKCP